MPTPHPVEKGKWKPRNTLEAVCQAPIPLSLTPSLQPVTEVDSPVVAAAHVGCESQPLGEGARPPVLGHPGISPPCSGGLADSAQTGTGMAMSCTQGGKAKGKGKGESFAEVTSKAASKPIGVEPPHRQTKITDTFKLAQTNSKLAKPPPPPTRLSLVLSLMHHMLSSMLQAKAVSVLALALVEVCNDMLSSDPVHANVWVSTAKWTPKGNLGVFTGPDVTHDALFATSHLLTTAISWALPDDPRISSCLNVKWGKCYILVLPPFIFPFLLPFQSHDLMSHGPSPDLSPDFHHMTTLIVLTTLLFIAHCPPY